MFTKIPNIDFIEKRRYAQAFSLILTLFSVLLLLSKGLNFTIDFTGGTIIEFTAKEDNLEATIKSVLGSEYGNFELAKTKLHSGDAFTYTLKAGASTVDSLDKISTKIKDAFPNSEIIKSDYIGPKVGAEFAWDSAKAITLALLAMMVYVWLRFDLKFGFGVMLALLHDVIITLGFFSLTGFQFDLTSIAVILTIVGYSINDSIVIYDRIRENIKVSINQLKRKEFGELVNLSVNETLSRTIMTSLTTLVVCIALFLFGGEALRGFSAALSFGIAFGTYSSIYISAPVLIFFARK